MWLWVDFWFLIYDSFSSSPDKDGKGRQGRGWHACSTYCELVLFSLKWTTLIPFLPNPALLPIPHPRLGEGTGPSLFLGKNRRNFQQSCRAARKRNQCLPSSGGPGRVWLASGCACLVRCVLAWGLCAAGIFGVVAQSPGPRLCVSARSHAALWLPTSCLRLPPRAEPELRDRPPWLHGPARSGQVSRAQPSPLLPSF